MGIRPLDPRLFQGWFRLRAGLQPARSDLHHRRILEIPVRQTVSVRSSRYQSRTVRSQVWPSRRISSFAAATRALDLRHRRRLDRNQRNLQVDRDHARRHGPGPRIRRALDPGSVALQARRAGSAPAQQPPQCDRLRRHNGSAGRRRSADRRHGPHGQRAGPPGYAMCDRRLGHRARSPEGHGRDPRPRRLRNVHRLPVGPAAAAGVLDLRHRRDPRSEERLQRQDLDEQGVRVHEPWHPVRAVRSRRRQAGRR